MDLKRFIIDLFVKRVEKKSDKTFIVKYRNTIKEDWKEREFDNHKDAQKFYLKRLAKVNTSALFITQRRTR